MKIILLFLFFFIFSQNLYSQSKVNMAEFGQTKAWIINEHKESRILKNNDNFIEILITIPNVADIPTGFLFDSDKLCNDIAFYSYDDSTTNKIENMLNQFFDYDKTKKYWYSTALTVTKNQMSSDIIFQVLRK